MDVGTDGETFTTKICRKYVKGGIPSAFKEKQIGTGCFHSLNETQNTQIHAHGISNGISTIYTLVFYIIQCIPFRNSANMLPAECRWERGANLELWTTASQASSVL